MRIAWDEQKGRPKGDHEVYRAHGTKRSTWCSWYVESVEKAHSMVAWWRDAEPGEYPLSDEWVVIVKGEEVARFSTIDALDATAASR